MKYLNIDIKESEESTNLESIERFENLIGAKLPNDYKEFLLKYNGGRPVSRDIFPVLEYIKSCKETGSAEGVDWFLALYNGEHNNLEEHYNDIYKNRIPNTMIPVAIAYGSNVICLVIKGSNYGKIYYWCFEGEAEDGEGTAYYDNVYLIANSFTDFINSLYEYK